MPRKSANTSLVFSIFRIHSYCVPVFFCVHFHCFGRPRIPAFLELWTAGLLDAGLLDAGLLEHSESLNLWISESLLRALDCWTAGCWTAESLNLWISEFPPGSPKKLYSSTACVHFYCISVISQHFSCARSYCIPALTHAENYAKLVLNASISTA